MATWEYGFNLEIGDSYATLSRNGNALALHIKGMWDDLEVRATVQPGRPARISSLRIDGELSVYQDCRKGLQQTKGLPRAYREGLSLLVAKLDEKFDKL